MVADDSSTACGEVVEWLRAYDIVAHPASDESVMQLIDQVQPRLVICRPGSTGIALFHALQEIADPPMVVLLSESPSAKDEVYCNGRMLVAVIRTPVQMASLAQFVRSVLGIASRLDVAALAALIGSAADVPPAPAQHPPLPLKVVH
ncbi:MAG: hypothetical protein KIT36_12025 [Alphaproteobacteria bacterium]|nr:hypothetical protein [Alphaproteobacteria bacterium]